MVTSVQVIFPFVGPLSDRSSLTRHHFSFFKMNSETVEKALILVFDSLKPVDGDIRNLLAETCKAVAEYRRYLKKKYPKSWKKQSHPKAKRWDKFSKTSSKLRIAAARNYEFIFKNRTDLILNSSVLESAVSSGNYRLAKWLIDERGLSITDSSYFYKLAHIGDLEGIKKVCKWFPEKIPKDLLVSCYDSPKRRKVYDYLVENHREKVEVSSAFKTACKTGNTDYLESLYDDSSDTESEMIRTARNCVYSIDPGRRAFVREKILSKKTVFLKDSDKQGLPGVIRTSSGGTKVSRQSKKYVDRTRTLEEAITLAIEDNDILVSKFFFRALSQLRSRTYLNSMEFIDRFGLRWAKILSLNKNKLVYGILERQSMRFSSTVLNRFLESYDTETIKIFLDFTDNPTYYYSAFLFSVAFDRHTLLECLTNNCCDKLTSWLHSRLINESASRSNWTAFELLLKAYISNYIVVPSSISRSCFTLYKEHVGESRARTFESFF